MILDHHVGIDERHLTVGALAAGDVDDAIDAFGRGRGPEVGLMTLAAAGFLFAFLELAAAKAGGLAVGVVLELLDLLAQAQVFVFQLSDAALEALDFAVAFVEL